MRGPGAPAAGRVARRLSVLVLAAGWIGCGTASAQALSTAETARIDREVRAVMVRTGIPSTQIAVVRGAHVVYARSWGKASSTIPVATDALPYQIASNSKQFTAAAILLLQRDGRLRLDDHVADYLTGITGGNRMTIRQLLSHTSGLRDYWPQDYVFPAMMTPITPQQIVDRWAKGPLDFEPGTKWRYSNTGYVVAGLIVEKVSGEPLMAFLRRRIFAPLGMAVVSQDDANGPGFPQGYSRDALGPVHLTTPPARGWLYAAGELSMSATDLAKWDIARLSRTLLAPQDWAEQETEVKLPDGTGTRYGLGVGVGVMDGHQAVAHAGESAGFLSVNTAYADGKTAVVVLTNGDFSNGSEIIAERVAATVLPPVKADANLSNGDATAAAQARRTLDQLSAGALDRGVMTANGNAYFSASVLGSYHRSLAALGRPTAFGPAGKVTVRGGYIKRDYKVSYRHHTLSIQTLAEPGRMDGTLGRYEQFIVTPVVE